MLAGAISPRPRPPARTRRASSQVKSSPPPPYHPSLPDDATTSSEHGRLSAESLRNDWLFPFSTQSDQWNERSSVELTNLLHKADELIKDRELELNVTSAVCKSLYENNRELKSRHQALLARFPSSPVSSSPAGSSSPSPMSPDSQLPQSPHYYSADESQTASAFIPRPRPHYRRVSVSPADLALLSDQNAELLAKLEKLETESIQADLAGRRKLRSLEKEIQGLRDELDKTRAKSDELEKKAKVFSERAALRDEEAERRKQEREERLRALRSKAGTEDQEREIRDFAPGGALSSKFAPSRRLVSEAVRPQRPDSDGDERPRSVSFQPGLSRSVSLSHHFRLAPSPESPTTPPQEYALVSQLLLKIRELEVTNAQITEQQARTVAQLQNVQKDATSLRLVYESLGDGAGVEWVAEDREGSPDVGNDEENETIRFASLRRSLSADGSIDFAGGIDADMQSSLKHTVFPDHVPIVSHLKVRRSVVGLFDSPRGEVASPLSPVSETAASVLEMMIPGLPPVPFVPQPSNTSSAVPSRSPSPTLSGLAGTVSTPNEDVFCRPTLDSELGAAFGGDWSSQSRHGSGSDDHHFRTSSIVSLTSVVPQAHPESTSSIVSISSVPTRPESEQSADVSTPARPFARRNSALQPGSWHGTQLRNKSDPDVKSASPAERLRRKSHTIRMRAAHWKDGRFSATLIPIDKHSSLDMNRPSTPVPERLVSAFDAIVDTMNRTKGEIALSLHRQDDEGRSSVDISTVGKGTTASPPAPRQRGIVALVLEIWLWLQFAIIVVVFVWAMARRGPKVVLEEAGRRKTGSLMR